MATSYDASFHVSPRCVLHGVPTALPYDGGVQPDPTPYAMSGRPSTGRASRTFKPRRGRLTVGEREAVDTLLPSYLLHVDENTTLSFDPLVLDIGFGNGETTVALSNEFWAATIVAIDVHTPGFGVLARALHDNKQTNVRIIDADALDVLRWSVRDHSVSLINVAFPDPWPKAGHHHRRLVLASFLDVLAQKLRVGGLFRFASDWAPYTEQVEELFANDTRFEQAPPWSDRPITKFQQRAIKVGRECRDLAYSLRDATLDTMHDSEAHGSESNTHQHELGDLSDLRDGQFRVFEELGEFGVIVCRVAGSLCAVVDNCSHRDAKLSEGRLRSGLLTCPLHGAQFDVRTGAHQGPPATVPIATYRVTEVDGVASLEFPG